MKANYLILYTGGNFPDNPADLRTEIQAWDEWYTRVGAALVDAGNPFSSRATSITSDGMVSHKLPDCMPSGYAIIQAESLEDAVTLASTCPILKDGARVSIYESYDALSM